MNHTNPPEDDSPDLTDGEISQAIVTSDWRDIADTIKQIHCNTCQGPMMSMSHQLRRRKPHLYWRANLTCLNHEHKETKIFQVDWIKQQS